MFVSIETPYNAWNPWLQRRNIQYAIAATHHATSLGDATYVPHLCNTQIVYLGFHAYIGDSLGDFLLATFGKSTLKYNSTREKVLEITHSVRKNKVDKVVCYTDFGISRGMQEAIDVAKTNNIPIEERTLPPDLMKHVYTQSIASTVVPTALTGGIVAMCIHGLLSLRK